MVKIPGMAGMLVGVVELAAGIEPVETIGHHQPHATLGERVIPACRSMLFVVE